MSACPRPVSDETLLEWWTGELAAPERQRLDRHLLGCAACSARAAQLAVRRGVPDPGLSHGPSLAPTFFPALDVSRRSPA